MPDTLTANNVLPAEPASPETINSCPSCSHWLPDGTLVCPDCGTLTYARYLGELAGGAQQFESQGQWLEARDRWRSMLQWMPESAEQSSAIQGHIDRIDARFADETARKAKWTKRLGPFAPIAFFLLKLKSALFLLFKLKFFLGFFGFFALYWALAGWRFALGATVCILIHEMGHYVAVKRRGLKAELPMLIPGLGAYVKWYSQGVSREDLASISLAGPLYGLGAAAFCLFMALTTHSVSWLVIANFAIWINLFNLTPVLGFDGSQAVYALSRVQRILLTLTCLLFFGLSVVGSNPDRTGTQWVFLIVGAGMAWRCFTHDMAETPHTRTMVQFLSLIIVLGFMLYLAPVPGGF